MVIVNGQVAENAAGKTIAQILEESGFVLSQVAVECNGQIIFKDSYAHQVLTSGDVLEVVTFVGGG